MVAHVSQLRPARFPILALLHPRERTRLVLIVLALAVLVGAASVRLLHWPVWVGSAVGLAMLLGPGVLKWRDDRRRYGQLVMALSVLLAAQGFHTVEHTAQMIQYHILKWPPFASSGLISAANSEWVHFVWNWLVVAMLVYLVRGGMRNPWAWLVLAWSLAHAIEHSYMLIRYLEMVGELRRLGYPELSAQGLPGILGRDGWLARSPATQGSFICRLPGVTTAPRIDIHFWWNAGEIALLMLAAHHFLKGRFARPAYEK
jgi:hypothetical protein